MRSSALLTSPASEETMETGLYLEGRDGMVTDPYIGGRAAPSSLLHFGPQDAPGGTPGSLEDSRDT